MPVWPLHLDASQKSTEEGDETLRRDASPKSLLCAKRG
jgi:hypothetical protein